jgi:bacteriorhodopsin
MNILQVFACVVFLIFFIYFFYFKKQYLIASVLLIAFVNYSIINCDQGVITNKFNVSDYLSRYLDWIVTTPILLFLLMKRLKIKDKYLIFIILAMDVLMIYTGIMASLASNNESKWILYCVSVLLFLIIFAKLFTKNSFVFWYLFIIWSIYPIVWILHEIRKLNNTDYDYYISALDMISKIGLAFLV